MASESYNDGGAPPSDDDPYSSSSSSTNSYTVDRSGFPKPIPILGSLMGFDDKLFAAAAGAQIRFSAKRIKRPLTSEEANALAYWTSKQISIISYGSPIGIAAGAWRCYDTRSKFRFPFYGPNMATFNPQEFPNGRALVKGPRAVYIWHVFRTLFYTGAGKFVSSILFGSYAMSVAAVGETGDPRLKAYREALKSTMPTRPGTTRLPQSPSIGTQQAKQAAGSSEKKQYDDASPSGGMFSPELPDNSNAVNAGNPPPAESVEPQWQQPARISRSDPVTREAESEERPFSPFDDASPTGGQGMQTGVESFASSGGSAWDRVRSGQKPVPRSQTGQSPSWQNTATQQPRETAWSKQRSAAQGGESSSDAFTSSSTQEQRRYGKEEAQKEFDARVERERKGGDFAAGGGDQKRW